MAIDISERYRRRSTRLRPVLPRLDWMIFPNLLAYVLSWYGLLIGKYPAQVICTALGIAGVCSSGLMRLTIVELKSSDFLSRVSQSHVERGVVGRFANSDAKNPSTWPMPFGYHSNGSASIAVNSKRRQKRNAAMISGSDSKDRSCRMAPILIVAKHNRSDLTGRSYDLKSQAMLKEIDGLEKVIYNITVEVNDSNGRTAHHRYEDSSTDGRSNIGLCVNDPKTDKCRGFTLKIMKELFPPLSERDNLPLLFTFITWPKYKLVDKEYDLSNIFGNVETKGEQANGLVTHIGAIRQAYCLRSYFPSSFGHLTRARVWIQWEEKLHAVLMDYKNQYFDVYWMTESKKSEQQDALVSEMLPKIVVTFAALMLWCAAGAMMGDAVQAKSWVGFLGIMSTMTACAAGMGIMLWKSPVFKVHLMAVPLLTLAVGLDDMFILFEAWNSISPRLPVEERMMTAMNIGGTSIIITFCINLIDFIVGNYTPFPAVQLLSDYAIATMTIDFIFQMTIFAPCLVLFGRAEDENQHSCLCCCSGKLKTRDDAIEAEKNACYLLCCSGGFDKSDDDAKFKVGSLENTENPFKPTTALVVRLVTSLPFRITAMGLLIVYLAVAIWSIMQIEVGMKPERIYNKGSNLYEFFQQQRILFMGYGREIAVVVNNEINYTSPEIQRKLIAMVDKIEQEGFFWKDEDTKFWLRDFNDWAWRHSINVSTFANNTDILFEMQREDGFFSVKSYEHHLHDIRMSADGYTILKSRFWFRSKDMTSPSRQMAMMQNIRTIVNQYRPQIDMFPFNPEFELFDSYLTAVPATLYYCGITLAAVFGIALIMIPHPACMFWVAAFVTSVLVGIIGLMRLWEMDLDSVSLINLLIAISFCSDLIAHPVYIFMVTAAVDESGKPLAGADARLFKARAVVAEVGGAALPACVGTTLSVIAMSNSDAYVFITFFRVMFLAVVLSILHSIAFVPAFLSFIGPSTSRMQLSIRTGHEDWPESLEEETTYVTTTNAVSSKTSLERTSAVDMADVLPTQRRNRHRKRRSVHSPPQNASSECSNICTSSSHRSRTFSGFASFRQYEFVNSSKNSLTIPTLPTSLGVFTEEVVENSNKAQKSNTINAIKVDHREKADQQLGFEKKSEPKRKNTKRNKKTQGQLKRFSPPIGSYAIDKLRRFNLGLFAVDESSEHETEKTQAVFSSDALCNFRNSRTGLTMLPAIHKFNM